MTIWLCALAYFAATFGVPLSVPVASSTAQSQSATPFPCRGHGCGCQTEEQCRRHCCCFSDTQRVAWYRQHEMAIPSELQLSTAATQPTAAAKGCCKSRPTKSDERDGGVLMVRALKCQGQGSFWLSVGAVLPVLPVDPWEQHLDAGQWLRESQPFLLTCAQAPPVPPPKIAV